MDHRKKIISGILILSVFVLIVSICSLYVQVEISSGNACGCAIPIPVFIPFIASIGLFIGTVTYYLFSPKFDRKIDKKVLLNFFEGEERKVFEVILNKKEVNQAEIVRESGLSKVKVSRILKRFESKGLVEKISVGKINKVKLSEGILKLV